MDEGIGDKWIILGMYLNRLRAYGFGLGTFISIFFAGEMTMKVY